MANKTLLQTRTDYPAVTPIDPDECLILDQQTDRPEGEQSTVATLSELIATGGRTVTTAVSYETLYADSVVNVSAASITITVGSVMRNGSRLLIRRTSAYDGNPVTITPPSGATFEGLASIDLYGQCSYVELERISATVFAVKEWIDEYDYTPTIGIAGDTTGFTYSQQIGRIRRNKKTIELYARVRIDALSGIGTGRVTFSAPPVDPADNLLYKAFVSAWSLTVSQIPSLYGGFSVGGYIEIQGTDASGNIYYIQNTNIKSGSTFVLNGTYEAKWT